MIFGNCRQPGGSAGGVQGGTDVVRFGGLYSEIEKIPVLACITLGEMGEPARPAILDLEGACKRSLNTRRAALDAIRKIRSEAEE